MVAMEDGQAQGYALAYEVGQEAVADQLAALRDIRARAGTLASAAAVVAGLGTTLALDDGRGGLLTAMGWTGLGLALVGMVTVLSLVAWTWQPVDGEWRLDPGIIIGSYLDGDTYGGLAATHRELALHLGQKATRNQTRLDRRLRAFTWALVAFGILVAGLTLTILDVTT